MLAEAAASVTTAHESIFVFEDESDERYEDDALNGDDDEAATLALNEDDNGRLAVCRATDDLEAAILERDDFEGVCGTMYPVTISFKVIVNTATHSAAVARTDLTLLTLVPLIVPLIFCNTFAN